MWHVWSPWAAFGVESIWVKKLLEHENNQISSKTQLEVLLAICRLLLSILILFSHSLWGRSPFFLWSFFSLLDRAIVVSFFTAIFSFFWWIGWCQEVFCIFNWNPMKPRELPTRHNWKRAKSIALCLLKTKCCWETFPQVAKWNVIQIFYFLFSKAALINDELIRLLKIIKN